MSDMMPFPASWEDFLQEYSFKDKEEIYTNGSWLIPTFRVEQMMDHYAGNLKELNATKEADIEELLKEREWINVKDEMPPEDEAVLAWNKEGFPMIDVWSGKMWGYAWTVDEISHWMPLPQKPESEDE